MTAPEGALAALEADGGQDPTISASIAKFYASEAAMEVVEEALQVFGGYGYTRFFPVEKLLRDIRLLKIYEGTSEVQRIIVSGFVLNHYRPVMPPLEPFCVPEELWEPWEPSEPVDPVDPDVVYVAAQGPLWSPGGDRGLYKSTDGGVTWNKTPAYGDHDGPCNTAVDDLFWGGGDKLIAADTSQHIAGAHTGCKSAGGFL